MVDLFWTVVFPHGGRGFSFVATWCVGNLPPPLLRASPCGGGDCPIVNTPLGAVYNSPKYLKKRKTAG